MATPHVSGVAALMLSRNASLSPDQVASILTSTARPFPATCSPCGAGIVNASAAVDAVPGVVMPPVVTLAEVESNNSTRAAQNIATTPVVINGTVASKTDTDYFKTSVPAGGRLVGTLTPNSSANYNLSAYNAAGKLLGSSSQGMGLKDVFTVTNSGTTAATVYWRVIYASGATGAAGSYTLGLNR
jgi:serine protease